jgi:hypothetical protein
MPFKTLTSPRKHHALDAEVSAFAYLAAPGFVAAVTNGPVRLAMQPLGSGNGKVTNVSLQQADGIALLSRDVAVVKSGDDLWALLDITHTAKMDQVGRDARALIARPLGETALVIGWDGSATQLKSKGHEVDARQFAVRGNLRTADIVERETFAVVDGPGGGQLRIHPGDTPEAGANGRVDLPAEAAKLDRLRGGVKLTALFSRGKSAVCVVRGGPARLVAKMIHVGGKIADVGVLETSLFVAFEDGSVALYDDAALDKATESSAEATASIKLGSQGDPRAMIPTLKGTPTLWIGTSNGDFTSVTVVRKGTV